MILHTRANLNSARAKEATCFSTRALSKSHTLIEACIVQYRGYFEALFRRISQLIQLPSSNKETTGKPGHGAYSPTKFDSTLPKRVASYRKTTVPSILFQLDSRLQLPTAHLPALKQSTPPWCLDA